MKNNVVLEVKIYSKKAVKKIEEVTRLVIQLETHLKQLKNIEIGVEIIKIQKKWWQFWK